VADTKTVAQQAGTVQSTIRVDRELNIRAKIVAAKTGLTVNALFAEGLAIRVAQLEKKLEAKRAA
jgi:predicted HicB family RNase H-like nuclease